VAVPPRQNMAWYQAYSLTATAACLERVGGVAGARTQPPYTTVT